ncbi:hypothetical protein [Blastococcus sp. TF02-8]|uniref:hypothetical protein n=1 Tax=Blastococcus sp. TF02-8 TaxID=2250574 RepID=UPI00351132C7
MSAPVVVQVAPPGEAVTVYPVIALPPSLAGAVQLTDALVCPAVAEGCAALLAQRRRRGPRWPRGRCRWRWWR